jgi:hypothetical protein
VILARDPERAEVERLAFELEARILRPDLSPSSAMLALALSEARRAVEKVERDDRSARTGRLRSGDRRPAV